MDALIIKKPFLDKILSGEKTWELRGSRTHKRGCIALIESGSGLVMGECVLVDCVGPLDNKIYLENKLKHGSTNSFENKSYKNLFAWVLKNPKKYLKPKPYNHPMGAVIWVKLEDVYQTSLL